MDSTNNKIPVTLTDWQILSWERNGPALLQHSTSDICLRLVEATGSVAEAVRRNRYHLIIDELAMGFRRLLDVYNRVAYDQELGRIFSVGSIGSMGLEASIFYKFPRRCFLCGAPHCECNVRGDTDDRTKEDEKKFRELAAEALRIARINEKPPKTLDEFEEMFAHIYGQGHRYSNIDSINHHLMEEVGEVMTAHRNLKECAQAGFAFDEKENKKLNPSECWSNFCSEIADIVSWTTALRRKADFHITRAYGGSDTPVIPKLSQKLVFLFELIKV